MASGLGWYEYKSFAVQEYQHYAKFVNGNMHWIVPGKFIAFEGPMDVDDDRYGSFTPPDDYIPTFTAAGVTLVVELDKF